MKRLLFYILLISFSGIAQKKDSNFVTVVTYKMVKADFDNSKDVSVRKEFKEMTENMFKAYDKVACELIYSKEKSLFRQVEKMAMEGDRSYQMASVFASGKNIRDLRKREKIKQVTVEDKQYNISYPIDEYQWELVNETKMINGYKCYKAKTSYENVNRNKKTASKIEVVAWYSPEIPCSYGPRGFDGLPGLVLEVQPNKTFYFYAAKIEFEVADKSKELDAPLKGTAITKDEFEALQTERTEKNKAYRESMYRK